MIQDTQLGMSGVVGTLVEDTTFEENSCCGVCRGHSGQESCSRRYRYQEVQIIKDINDSRWSIECLELSGRLLKIQHSMRILAVVYVRDILGRKVAPRDTDSNIYR